MFTRLMLGVAAMFSFLMIGCSDSNDGISPDGTGRLVVRMTDAPFPYDWVEAANVTVFKVEARRVSDDTEGEETEGSPFVTLMEEEISMNLLELTNGLTETLVDAEVPAGTYDLVRVYVRGIEVVLTDERTFPLDVPSGAQSGIKVFVEPGITVTSGLTSDLLLDFDVHQSFVAKGNIETAAGINGFNFTPSIKATNASTAGTLAGRISYIDETEEEIGLEGATVSLWQGETEAYSTLSDVDGNYAFPGIDPGTYTAQVEAMDFLPAEPVEVTIVVANLTTQDFLLEVDPAAETETETEGGN